MYKINLHAHTKYSDGSATIRQHAVYCKENGYSCCCITDHVYSEKSEKSMEMEDWQKAVKEAEAISKEIDFPIIVGIETSVAKYREVLVFGKNAITALFRERIYETLTFDVFKSIIKLYAAAVIWCHPIVDKRFYDLKFWEILDGYELYNNGAHMFRKQEIPYEISNLTQFSNADAHRISRMCRGYNWFEDKITNENSLIYYIKANKKVKMFAIYMELEE